MTRVSKQQIEESLKQSIGEIHIHQQDIHDLFYDIVRRKDQERTEPPGLKYFDDPTVALSDMLARCRVTAVYARVVSDGEFGIDCYTESPYGGSERMGFVPAMDVLIDHLILQSDRIMDVIHCAKKMRNAVVGGGE